MTAFSLLAIPATLIACLRPAWLLQLVMIFAIFEAAAALALGGFGLQPALLPAAIFVAYVILQLLLGVRYIGRRDIWWAVLPFLYVTAWAVIGSWLLPRLFAGEVYVWPQKIEPPFVALPLEPSGSSLNQVLYIVVDAFVLVTSALFVGGSRSSSSGIMKAYFFSGLLAALIGFWQFANKLAGIPYPETFFFSNPGWSILSEQNIGLAPRINGTFSEPSSFAGYMVGIIGATGWLILQGHQGKYLRILFAIALLALVCSTSTTGYGVLALMLFGLPIYAVVTGSWHLLSRIILAVGILGMIITAAYMTVSASSPETERAIQQIVTGTLSKNESSSYQERTSADLDSLNLIIPTYGLGVGWGSNRSSSLIPGTLANLGFWGCLVVVWFALRLGTLISRARKATSDPKDLLVLDGATGAIVGYIAAGVLSGPTITSAAFYLLIGALIGNSARVLAVSDARRRLYPSAARQRAMAPIPS